MTMKIYRSSRELPANAQGITLWLQVRDGETWHEVSGLRRRDSRDLLRWLDRHPLVTNVRVAGEFTG